MCIFLLKLSGSPDLAEELTQATFVAAFEHLDQFQGRCKMSVWLCQIAKNQYYAYCRKSMHFTGEEVPKNYESKENMEEDIIKREEHLKECSECRKYMNRMKQELFVREEMGDYLEEEKLLRNRKEVLKKEVKADFMAKVVQFDIPANLMIFIAIFYRNVSFYRIGLCMNIFGWTTEKKRKCGSGGVGNVGCFYCLKGWDLVCVEL